MERCELSFAFYAVASLAEFAASAKRVDVDDREARICAISPP